MTRDERDQEHPRAETQRACLLSCSDRQGREKQRSIEKEEPKASLRGLSPACGHVQAGLELSKANGREDRVLSLAARIHFPLNTIRSQNRHDKERPFAYTHVVGEVYLNSRKIRKPNKLLLPAIGLLALLLMSAPCAARVTFPDSHLEAAIRAALDKPIDDMTVADLHSLTALFASGKEISDLSGLEQCTALEYVDLSDNHISDLSPLATVTNVEILLLQSNEIADVAPLAGLVDLIKLDLDFNRVVDIAPLAKLTHLRWLGLWDCRVSDIGVLANLPDLVTLGLGGNPISDIAPLASLTHLYWLGLPRNTGISDLNPLARLTGLVKLSLGGNRIRDIAPLSGLTHLQGLGLGDNEIESLDPLSNLKLLQRLSLWGNKISNITPLAELVNLEQLWLDQNHISNISILSGLVHLNILGLGGNTITDLSPLAANKGVGEGDTITLTGNPLDFAPGSAATQVIDTLTKRGARVE